MSVRGWVKGCYWEARGSELVVDAAIGDTVLHIEHAGEFDDDVDDTSVGMWLDVNGTQLAYLSVDNDADTITLASPLTFAASVDDRVLVVSGGQVMLDYIARVDLGSGDPAEVVVPFGDRDLWPEGDYVDPVQVLLSDDLENIIDVPGRTPARDGAFTYNPLASGRLAADTSWPDLEWKVIPWAFDDQLNVPYDSATRKFTIAVPGVYLLNAGAGLESNSTGRRGLAIWVEHEGDPPLLARRIVIPADGLTATEATRIIRLHEGDRVYVEALQTSGAALDLLANITNIGILRVAP